MGSSKATSAPNLVIHGHFYQPPREDPWTDEIAHEPSAAPFRDWNERILSECYRANAFARLYVAPDLIGGLVNNYARMSFNVGPTLARFIARRDATTMARMREGDEEQVRRLGRGGALAQVWGHPITPLLSPRDRRTQILWGLLDFENRFGRKTEGIWLPETAVDAATLEALIEQGIAYTILAPEQISGVRPAGGQWVPVNRDTLDTGRAYRWMHRDGSGRSIALAVFNGTLSRALAFGSASGDSSSLISHDLEAAASSSAHEPRLVLVAADGELFGHHRRFADLTLAHVASEEAERRGVFMTNLGAYLAASPPEWEAALALGPAAEGTAWSCSHGLGRWRRHCGCAARSPAESGWSQAWRGPLRAAMDRLSAKCAAFFADRGEALFADPWLARDAYGAVIDTSPDERRRFLTSQGKSRLRAGERRSVNEALLLMEMQRSALLMYASCGWFFDDVAGVEGALVIRQAAFVLDGWRRLGGTPPTQEIMDELALARSNQSNGGTGADVLRRALDGRTTVNTAVASAALARGVGADIGPGPFRQTPGFSVTTSSRNVDGEVTTRGVATATHIRTGESTVRRYRAQMAPRFRPSCDVDGVRYTLDSLPAESRDVIVATLLAGIQNTPGITIEECEGILELSRVPNYRGDAMNARFEHALARALEQLLERPYTLRMGEASIQIVVRMLEALGGPRRRELRDRAQEWVFMALRLLSDAGERVPRTLLRLAEGLGLAVSEREGCTAR